MNTALALQLQHGELYHLRRIRNKPALQPFQVYTTQAHQPLLELVMWEIDTQTQRQEFCGVAVFPLSPHLPLGTPITLTIDQQPTGEWRIGAKTEDGSPVATPVRLRRQPWSSEWLNLALSSNTQIRILQTQHGDALTSAEHERLQLMQTQLWANLEGRGNPNDADDQQQLRETSTVLQQISILRAQHGLIAALLGQSSRMISLYQQQQLAQLRDQIWQAREAGQASKAIDLFTEKRQVLLNLGEGMWLYTMSAALSQSDLLPTYLKAHFQTCQAILDQGIEPLNQRLINQALYGLRQAFPLAMNWLQFAQANQLPAYRPAKKPPEEEQSFTPNQPTGHASEIANDPPIEAIELSQVEQLFLLMPHTQPRQRATPRGWAERLVLDPAFCPEVEQRIGVMPEQRSEQLVADETEPLMRSTQRLPLPSDPPSLPTPSVKRRRWPWQFLFVLLFLIIVMLWFGLNFNV
jgi:hypothetical protein